MVLVLEVLSKCSVTQFAAPFEMFLNADSIHQATNGDKTNDSQESLKAIKNNIVTATAIYDSLSTGSE